MSPELRAQLSWVNAPISHHEFSQRVFAGEFLVFTGVVRDFAAQLRKAVRESFAPHAPLTAHNHFSEQDYFSRIHDLQQKLRGDQCVYRHFRNALRLLGFDVGQMYRDRFILRVVPPIESHQGGYTSHVKPHRDTWGVNIYQQVNWWAPVFPIARNRTISFFPHHWDAAIANTTDSWSFDTYIKEFKNTQSGFKPSYPAAPQCLEPPQGSPFCPVTKPGDLMGFSAAHLHGSVINKSKFARFSFETRTLHLHDVALNRSAPNIDNRGSGRLDKIFSNLLTTEKLRLS